MEKGTGYGLRQLENIRYQHETYSKTVNQFVMVSVKCVRDYFNFTTFGLIAFDQQHSIKDIMIENASLGLSYQLAQCSSSSLLDPLMI